MDFRYPPSLIPRKFTREGAAVSEGKGCRDFESPLGADDKSVSSADTIAEDYSINNWEK